MFEIDGTYANRHGKYTVLALEGSKMKVRYENGEEARLNMNIQARIWDNIQVETTEVTKPKRKPRARKVVGNKTQHFIKVVSIPPEEGLAFPGWDNQVVMTLSKKIADGIRNGDRFIYYAMEPKVFLAVVTITGGSFSANPKKYTYAVTRKKANFFPVDMDAAVSEIEHGIPLSSMELDSVPNFGKLDLVVEKFYKINEDDFELLAEALTEITEEEEENDTDKESDVYEDEV